MSKVGGLKNFGYGKHLCFAGKQALRDRVVAGHFSTVATHAARWCCFAEWLKIREIRDARYILKSHVELYGRDLNLEVDDEEMAVSYAQNLLSSVNVVLCSMRGDEEVDVSPSSLVGKRSNVRKIAPIWLDQNAVQQLQNNLIEKENFVAAAMSGLARECGMRFKEASLLDARVAYREASRTQKVTVFRGVKGGNNARVIPIVEQSQMRALKFAADIQDGQDNFISENQNYLQHRNKIYNSFYAAGGEHFHDFRAAYACDRYFQMTGFPAPVLRETGDLRPTKEVDLSARAIISQELGHHRIEVVGAYVGGRR